MSLRAYSNPTLARVALAAIRAREVQLVVAEAFGNAIEVGKLLEEIEFYQRSLAALAAPAGASRRGGSQRPDASDQRSGACMEGPCVPQNLPSAHGTPTEEGQSLNAAA